MGFETGQAPFNGQRTRLSKKKLRWSSAKTVRATWEAPSEQNTETWGGEGVGTLRGGNFVAEYAEKVTWMSPDMGRNTLNLRECNQKKRNQGLGFWQSWAVDVCEDGNQRCGSNVLCDDCVWGFEEEGRGGYSWRGAAHS